MLEAQNLAARRGYAELFRDLCFRVDPGHALIVTGPNGTGKTTMLRILAGTDEPDAGEMHRRRRAHLLRYFECLKQGCRILIQYHRSGKGAP